MSLFEKYPPLKMRGGYIGALGLFMLANWVNFYYLRNCSSTAVFSPIEFLYTLFFTLHCELPTSGNIFITSIVLLIGFFIGWRINIFYRKRIKGRSWFG